MIAYQESDAPIIRPPPGGWTWIDHGIIRAVPDIGLLGFAVYMTIAMHADHRRQAHPSLATLAKICNSTERSVRRAVAKLVKAGFVKVEPRRGAHTGTLSNRYTLLPLQPADTTDPRALSCQAPGGLSCPPPGVSRVRPPRTPEPYEQEPIEQEPIEEERRDDDDESSCSWKKETKLAHDLYRAGLGNGRPLTPTDRRRILAVCRLTVQERLSEDWVREALDAVRSEHPTKRVPYWRECIARTASAHGVDLDMMADAIRVPRRLTHPEEAS